jgi:hypothetical protein
MSAYEGARRKTPHRIRRKLGEGKYLVEHPSDCECQMVYSVRHAPWVTYDQAHGVVACDHCKTEASMPCPSVRDRVDKRVIYMALDAIEDDLWKFQLKHENCPEPAKLE